MASSSAGNKATKQRRRRWCDSALEAPPGYRQLVTSVKQASTPTPAQQQVLQVLLTHLEALSATPYQHGNMGPPKAITAAAEAVAAACPADSPAWATAVQLVYELLFMHSSRPLHKQLLSIIRKLTPAHQAVVGQVLLGLVAREATAVLLAAKQQQQQQWELLTLPVDSTPQQQQQQQEQQGDTNAAAAAQGPLGLCVDAATAAAVLSSLTSPLPPAAASRGFDLAQAAISLLQTPLTRGWLQPASPLLLLAVARSTRLTLDPQGGSLQEQQQQGDTHGTQEQQQQSSGGGDQHSSSEQQQQHHHHLTPKTVELVQDAINVMYIVLQYHGQHMAAAAGVATPAHAVAGEAEAGGLALAAICEAATSMLRALQGCLVVREALASAAVVVWAAAVLPHVPPTAAALVFAAGLMQQQLPPAVVTAVVHSTDQQGGADSGCVSATTAALLQQWHSSSLLEQQLVKQGTSLARELQRTPLVARVCGLRGLLSAMPAAALAGDLGCLLLSSQPQVAEQSLQSTSTANSSQNSSVSTTGSCSFIMQCALPFAVQAAGSAPDAHFKFFATSLLSAVVQAATQLWGELQEQHLRGDSGAGAGADAASAPPASTLGGAESEQQAAAAGDQQQLVVPWLRAADAQAVMSLLTSHLDEPVAQVLAKVQEAFEALLGLMRCQRDSADKMGLPLQQMSMHAAGEAPASAAVTAAAGAEGQQQVLDASAFLQAATDAVLSIAPGRKGRYQPLAALLPHVGASALLQLQPSLVAETLEAMQSNLAASAAAGFFRSLLLQLRSEAAGAGAGGDRASAGGVSAAAGSGLLLQPVPAAMRPWCACWLPALLEALWGQGERARSYVGNYSLPMVLQAEPLLLQPLVDIILAAHAADDRSNAVGSVARSRDAAAALVVVLRTARRLQLVGDLDVLLPQQQQQQQQQQTQQLGDGGSDAADGGAVSTAAEPVSPAGLLLSAVSSASAALRTEALELVAVSARSTAPPGVLELLVARRWLTLCLRCTGADSRHKSLALWEKLLARQAAAVRAIRHRAAVAHTPGATGGAHPKALPRASRTLLAPTAAGAAGAASTSGPTSAAVPQETEAQAEQRQLQFLAWMSQTLLESLYPGGPYERKYFALELMAVLLQQWLHTGTTNTSDRAAGTPTSAAAAAASGVVHEPFLSCLLSPECVQTLLGCVVDSWDKMRMAAARVLELMPSPLPGCSSPQQLLPLLTWALQLLQSPRVRESDAGARTLQLLVPKYLVGLGLGLTVWPQPAVDVDGVATTRDSSAAGGAGGGGSSNEQQQQQLVQAAASLLGSLNNLLREQLLHAQADMAAASRQGLVHGTVLTLKYIAEVLPWSTLVNAINSCSISLCVPAAAAAACGLSGTPLQPEQQRGGDSDVAGVTGGSSGACILQLVVVHGPASAVLHCWLVDLVGLLTDVAELVKPLLSAQDVNVAANEVEEADDDIIDDPAAAASDLAGEATTATDAGAAAGDSAVPAAAAAAAAAGGRLSGPAVQLLISSCWTTWKETSLLIGTLAHRLPLPKSAAAGGGDTGGDTAGSNGKQQQVMECQQLEQLGSLQLSMLLSMKHNGAVEKGQAGFIALVERLLESPEPCLNQLPRVWLGRCLSRVLQPAQCRDDIVRRSAGLPFAVCSLFLAEPVGVPRQLLPTGLTQLLAIASDEGLQEPWSRVHAFNTLRSVFADSNMALDSSGYHASGVVAAINGMTAPAWEVRNAAALAFTALMMRTVGARNIDTQQRKLLKPLNQLAATPAGLHTHSLSSSSGSYSRGSAGSVNIVQGPTAVDFFARHPQLHTFLLQQLQDAVLLQQQQQQQGVLGEAGTGGNGLSAAATVPPSLFPSLILLSRLRPQLLNSTTGSSSSSSAEPQDVVAADTPAANTAAAAAGGGVVNGPLDPAVFVPAVLAVGQSPVMGVRSMAAAALAPLVPAEQLHAVCLRLAALLPPAAATHAAGNSSQQQQQCGRPSSNALHGTLLQLTSLLAAVSNSSSDQAGNPGSCAAAATLVQNLLPAFVKSCWLLAPALASRPQCSSSSSSTWAACCAVRQAYTAAAGQLLVLAYKLWPQLVKQQQQQQDGGGVQWLQQLVSALHGSCLAAVQATVGPSPAATCGGDRPTSSSSSSSSSSSRDTQDPFHSCWLRDCAALLLGPLLQLQLLLPIALPAAAAPTKLPATEQQQQAASAMQLQLLSELLPVCLQSSLYEVRGAALKACDVQLDRLLAVAPQLLLHQKEGSGGDSCTSTGNSSSSSIRASVLALSGCVWAALAQRQVVKVTKRLLTVWGQLQQLQQLGGGAWAGTTPGSVEGQRVDVEQLSQLLLLAGTCKLPAAQTSALLCAARVAAVGVGGEAQAAAAALQAVSDLIDSYSQPHQPEQLRAAAAEALQLSGLLLPLAQGSAATAATAVTAAEDVVRVSLRAWFLALRLMEDEDEQVRQAAAAAAQHAMAAVPSSLLQPLVTAGDQVPSTQPGVQQDATDAAAGVTGAPGSTASYVAAVQYSCFALLGHSSAWLCAGVVPDLVAALLEVIFPADTQVPLALHQHQQQQQAPAGVVEGQGGCLQQAGAPSGGASVRSPIMLKLPGVLLRRLFEREADNHHEEPLLLAQHAAAALRQVLAQQHQQQQQQQQQDVTHEAGLDGVLGAWCNDVVGQFLPAVADRLTTPATAAGGAPAAAAAADAHHPEVFVPLYRCCLGVWALGPWWLQHTAASSNTSSSSGSGAGLSMSSWQATASRLSDLRLPLGLCQAVQAAVSGTDGSSNSACSLTEHLFLLQ